MNSYCVFFLDEQKKNTVGAVIDGKEEESSSTVCNGEWKFPRHCQVQNKTCEYSAHWQFFPRKNEIKFTIITKQTTTWTGIAFSNDEKMVNIPIHRN